MSLDRETEKSQLSFAAQDAVLEERFIDAIALYERYIELDPADVTGIGSVAMLKVRIRANDATQACEHWLHACKNALQKCPKDPVAWGCQANALYLLARHEALLIACNQRLDGNTLNEIEHIVTLNWKGKVLCALGREEEGQTVLVHAKMLTDIERELRPTMKNFRQIGHEPHA